MSSLDAAEPTRTERRWLLAGIVAIAIVVLAQFLGGIVRTAVSPGPSALERVQTCLTERATPFQAVAGDPVAQSAGHGALRTAVEGNAVTLALGRSESDARRMYDDYSGVMTPDTARARLDLHGRVVFVWDASPTQSQRDFVYLCTLDVQP